MDKIKTLPDAIRYGAKLSIKVEGEIYVNPTIKASCSGVVMNGHAGTCAMGAAVLGLYAARGLDMPLAMSTSKAVEILTPLLDLSQIVNHPVKGHTELGIQKFSIRDCIVSLNDTHGWTREEIADWLEKEQAKR